MAMKKRHEHHIHLSIDSALRRRIRRVARLSGCSQANLIRLWLKAAAYAFVADRRGIMPQDDVKAFHNHLKRIHQELDAPATGQAFHGYAIVRHDAPAAGAK